MGRSKEPSLPAKYFCPLPSCGESFTRLANLRRHTKHVHEKLERDFHYHCDVPNCGKQFHKRKQLYDHKFAVHDSERKTKYACTECSASFPTPWKLKAHSKRHNGYECAECKFKAETWSALRRHKAKEHSTKHKCGYCDKEFSKLAMVKKHQRVHEVSVKCPKDGCDVELLPWRIAKHIKEAHADVLPDGRQLRQIDDVIATVLRDDDLPRKQTFDCVECGKTFGKARNLRLHQRNMHTSNDKEPTKRQPTLQCTMENCTCLFLSESKLQNHLNWHMGIKPFECPQVGCGVRFAGRSALQRHVKFKHIKLLQVYEAVHQLAECGGTGEDGIPANGSSSEFESDMIDA